MIEQLWRNVLAIDDMGETLVPSHELDDVVSILLENKIDLQKFGGNLYALISRGMPTIASLFGEENSALPTTPSVNKYISIVNRPVQSTLWLLAGFPDVIAWLNKKQKSFLSQYADMDEAAKAIPELYGFDLDAPDDFCEDNVKNPDGNLRAFCYRNLVRNYITQTGRRLEVAVEEGTKGDIYLGNEFLQMLGEESNFTLIAAVTTKYYMELKTHYAGLLPDETSLLAMSGILDANVYILGTGQIQTTQIVDLAKATKGKANRLLEFMIQFEALLFSIDTPEFAHAELLDACRDQEEAIHRSIHYVLGTYQGEPQIANDTRALMTSPQFRQLRDAVGVHNLSLLISDDVIDLNKNQNTTTTVKDEKTEQKVKQDRSNEARPWVRYFAKMIDITLISSIMGIVVANIFPAELAFFLLGGGYLSDVVFMFMVIQVEAFVLASFGNTPGKWLLKTKLMDFNSGKLSYGQVFKRNNEVLLKGFGLGIMIISTIAMIISYQTLKNEGVTTWDRNNNIDVNHSPIGGRRIFIAAVYLSGWLFYTNFM